MARFAAEWDAFADGRLASSWIRNHAGGHRAEQPGAVRSPADELDPGRIYFRLPIRIGDHRYQIGHRGFEEKNLGLVMCYRTR